MLGIGFQNSVKSIDHWIAFFLLGAIGVNMIKEIFESDEDEKNDRVDFKEMLVLAIATSIDALAVGVTFAFLEINIILAIIIIGITTFIFSISGVKIGNVFGDKYEKKSQIVGGVILILMGIKILFEHVILLKG